MPIGKIERLIAFIAVHGFVAYPMSGMIHARCDYFNRDSDWAVVEPTLEAVRQWLGY